MNSTKTPDKTDPREIRRKLGLNQQQFWSKIGVTQSGGSRYESGRNMPRPVRELLRLVHVDVAEGAWTPAALPLRWSAPAYAPQLAATGRWEAVSDMSDTRTGAPTMEPSGGAA